MESYISLWWALDSCSSILIVTSFSFDPLSTHGQYVPPHSQEIIVTISSSACTNEPSGEDLCTGYVAVTEKVLKSDCEILTG